jgi:hypothetical protein
MITIEYLKNLYLMHGAEWDEDINIFGIRDIDDIQQDVFNDYICVATDTIYKYNATVDPAVYWTKMGGAGTKQKGVAHLCLGFYKNAYKVGIHKSYEALIQKGGPVTIWRDKNHNFENDDNVIESGFFGINIHRASAYTRTQEIGRYSAGCQVIQDPHDFNDFMKHIMSSDKYQKLKSEAKFSYMLFSKSEFGGMI